MKRWFWKNLVQCCFPSSPSGSDIFSFQINNDFCFGRRKFARLNVFDFYFGINLIFLSASCSEAGSPDTHGFFSGLPHLVVCHVGWTVALFIHPFIRFWSLRLSQHNWLLLSVFVDTQWFIFLDFQQFSWSNVCVCVWTVFTGMCVSLSPFYSIYLSHITKPVRTSPFAMLWVINWKHPRTNHTHTHAHTHTHSTHILWCKKNSTNLKGVYWQLISFIWTNWIRTDLFKESNWKLEQEENTNLEAEQHFITCI